LGFNSHRYLHSYARLGLAASLDPLTPGGTEQAFGSSVDHLQLATQSVIPSVDHPEKGIPSGFGRIIRDAAGSVVGVELNEKGPEAKVNVEDIDDVDSRIDPEVRRQWVSEFTKGNVAIRSNEGVLNGEPHVYFFVAIPVQPPFRQSILDTSRESWNTRTLYTR
jgi:nucleolar protein 16